MIQKFRQYGFLGIIRMMINVLRTKLTRYAAIWRALLEEEDLIP